MNQVSFWRSARFQRCAVSRGSLFIRSVRSRPKEKSSGAAAIFLRNRRRLRLPMRLTSRFRLRRNRFSSCIPMFQVVPDGIEPPLPGCRPGVVAAGPRDHVGSGSRGTRTHNGVTAPVFETGSSSGRMTSEKFRGLESNQRPPGSEPGVATSSNHPGVGAQRLRKRMKKFLRGRRGQI